MGGAVGRISPQSSKNLVNVDKFHSIKSGGNTTEEPLKQGYTQCDRPVKCIKRTIMDSPGGYRSFAAAAMDPKTHEK